jgi:hypothetical protein
VLLLEASPDRLHLQQRVDQNMPASLVFVQLPLVFISRVSELAGAEFACPEKKNTKSVCHTHASA